MTAKTHACSKTVLEVSVLHVAVCAGLLLHRCAIPNVVLHMDMVLPMANAPGQSALQVCILHMPMRARYVICSCTSIYVVHSPNVAPSLAHVLLRESIDTSCTTTDGILCTDEVAAMADATLEAILHVFVLGAAVQPWWLAVRNAMEDVAPAGNVVFAIAEGSLLSPEMAMSPRPITNCGAILNVVLHPNVMAATMTDSSHKATLEVHVLGVAMGACFVTFGSTSVKMIHNVWTRHRWDIIALGVLSVCVPLRPARALPSRGHGAQDGGAIGGGGAKTGPFGLSEHLQITER